MGEVHTGLLQHSTAMTPALTAQLLDLAMGQRVRRAERPIAYAVSPDTLTGVDCALSSSNGARPRAVGTAVSHASITGGHIVQGSAHVRAVPSDTTDRRLWSHYLARPGTVEVFHRGNPAYLAEGFLRPNQTVPETLDLGAISGRALDTVQFNPELDRHAPFRSARTKLRWVVADKSEHDDVLTFTIENNTVRTAHLPGRDLGIPSLVALCEDLALHDWLLTTLLAIIERSAIGTGTRRDVVDRLAPAIDYLLHLWMPAARLDESVADLWDSLERRPGFTRQWQTSVARVRDQVALATIVLAAGERSREPQGVRSAARNV